MASDEELAARARRGAVDLTALLPTSILAYIFSLLPLRTALLCGTVSRPWLAARREMLSRAVDFDFGPDFSAGMSPEQYSAAVDLALAAREAPTLDRIKIFFHPGMTHGIQRLADPWIELAASKSVRSLEFANSSPLGCLFPGSLFNSRSLTHLSLSNCYFFPSLEPLELPSLRTLSFRLVNVNDETVAGLLSSCSHLVSLSLTMCIDFLFLKISLPPCLRSLTIISCLGLQALEIDAPLLKSFHVSNCARDVVLKDVSGLDDAYINTSCWSSDPEILWQFASAFKHVTSLTLKAHLLMGIYFRISHTANLANVLPLTFCNLKSLYLYFESDQIRLLLWEIFSACSFPAIESLFIECVFGHLDYVRWTQADPAAYFFALNEPKVVVIKGLVGFEDQMNLAELILSRAFALETLVMFMTTEHSEDVFAAHRYQLEALPKVSKNAQILLCGVDDDLAGMPLPASPHAEVHQEALRAQLALQL